MNYAPKRLPQSEFRTLRSLRQHALHWPGQGRPLVLLHGWMDLAASFQFLVDALDTERPIWALDWRGFGQSDPSGMDAYWFADYLGDLEAWLDLISPTEPVDLVGHSMGGNVAMLYAGVRLVRVRRLVNLEGYGLPDSPPEQAPERMARWLDELREPSRLAPYADLDAVAARLRKTNPRLAPERAAWLATQWSRPGAAGGRELCADAVHKRSHAVLYRRAEALACWARITAPVLFIEGEDDSLGAYFGRRYPRSDLLERLAVVPQLQHEQLSDCGHMLHHDRPEAVAALLQDFLLRI